jgi:hydrogenase expression/formation protein HypE
MQVQGAVCPVPLGHAEQIVLGHGSGGRLTHDLIERHFLPAFQNPILAQGNDAGVVPSPDGRLAISTDAHVVSPLFFPGGDIGRLAVCGTVNDVAMLGARPLYVTASFILEEGLNVAVLERVLTSMRQAAEEAGVQIVAGDTKVVQKGKADGMYISTTGVGVLETGVEIGGAQARDGDAVILSGPMGEHGIAVLAARGELGFEADVTSDVAPLNHLIRAMLEASRSIHVLRDPTRGGVATTLNEIARQSGVGIVIREDALPVGQAVSAACELLGFDPLYVANEGKLVAVVGQEDTEKLLQVMHSTRYGEAAVVIGEVKKEPCGRVLEKTRLGSLRVVDALPGELLPRIC